MIYTLRIMSYSGTVPWAKHYTGRVEGEYPTSCHGGTRFNGADGPLKGKTTCFEGHILPEKIEWAVEASWSEGKYERFAANHFDGDGPNQYLEESDLVRDAIQRFLGVYPQQWWEEQYPLPQPGDQLYLGHLATRSGERYSDGYGHMLAEIPPKAED
jgi:hypothetical protein